MARPEGAALDTQVCRHMPSDLSERAPYCLCYLIEDGLALHGEAVFDVAVWSFLIYAC